MSLVAPELAGRVLGRALAHGGDLAELYAEDRQGFALSLDEGRVEAPQSGREAGVCVRVVQGESTYYGHVDGLAEPDLMRVAGSVAEALRGAGGGEPVTLAAAERARVHPVALPPDSVPAERKAELLRASEERARAAGGEIAQVRVGYAESRRRVEVYNSNSRAASDDRTRVRLSVQAVARRDDRVETGSDTRGGHAGFELLETDPEEVAERASRRALALLDAVDAPTGRLPVVVGNGFGGVLLHEAVGHGLEADAIQKGASVYAGKLGEQLAEPFVTAYDDGERTGEWGSDGIDDEGTPTRRTTIIEDGRLTSYLYDLLTRPPRRRGLHRERAALLVPAPADPADDQHLLRARPGDRRGAHRRRGQGPLRRVVRRRAGGAGHRRLRVRRVRGLPDRGRPRDRPRARGHPHRQRHPGARGDRRDRRRPRDRHRLLRQGGPVGAGGRGPAARAHPGAHRGRHGMSEDLEAVARRAVEAALDAGATDAEAFAEEDESRRIRVYQGEVESLSDAGGRGVGVRAFVDRRWGYSYSTDLSEDGLRDVGRAAREAAAVADADEWAGLPERCGATPVEGLASPELGRWTTERKVELALAAERAARAHEGVTQVESTVYSDSEASVALSNSHGFAGAYDATQAWAYTSAFAGEGSDLMTGLGVAMGRDPAALDPEAIGAEAAERALALVGARQPESRRCPVVLDAFVAASFVAFIGGMLSADAVQRGRSLFAGTRGRGGGGPRARAGGRRHRPRRSGQRAVRRRGLADPPDAARGGRPAAHLPLRRPHGAARRERDHGQRGAGLLPLAAVGGDVEPDRRVPARETWPSSSATPARGCT